MNEKNTLPEFFICNPDISVRLMEDIGGILYHPDTAEEKYLNPTGLFIWRRLDGSNSMHDIVDEIVDSFAGARREAVYKDIQTFLDDLALQRFVNTLDLSLHRPERETPYPNWNDAPKSLDVSLTGKCNLRCTYCFYAREMTSRPDLDMDRWKVFFEELSRLAVRDVCLSGGEVFTRPDLWEIIDAIIERRMRFSLLTNGTLITDKTLTCLMKGRRLRRLNSIQVSIDGSCAEIHDRSRGKGSFERAVKGLRLLKEAGLPVTSRVTVNRHNVDDLENIAGLLLDEIGISAFGTNDAVPIGAGCANREHITLSPQQEMESMKVLARLEAAYKGRITAMAGPLAKWRYYGEMEHARITGEQTARWQMGCLTACGCVFSKLAVHHDGVITPCNMLSGLELGRINIDPIKMIWTSHPILKALKDRRRIPMNEVPGCEDCEWAPFCNGSCPGLAYEMTGDFNRANPHDCYRRFLAATGGIRD